MILPIRTNILPRRTPYANYGLIIINIVIFAASSTFHELTGARQELRPWADTFMLTPAHPYLWQFISYAFLHGGFWHILGNMFFLYLFGANVNDELGHVAYVCFYLAGAVFSAIGYILINAGSAIPILGASGAIAAVTGAYLILFPKTLITVVYWFFIIGTIDIPAWMIIGLKLIIFDNVLLRDPRMNIAYNAHIAGYGFGIIVSVFLLSTHLLRPTGVDLWTVIKQWNRRRVFRDVVASGYDPYTGRTAKRIKAKDVTLNAQQQKILDLRSRISSLLSEGNLTDASATYVDLIHVDPQQILPRQQMLDIANQLMSAGQWLDAAEAYEKFIAHYGTYEYTEQVQLMLGILYSRYLKQPEKAVKYLKSALERLHDPSQIKLCKDELARLES